MVWVIVLSNIIAVSVSFLFLNQLVRLTRVKGTRLVPFLLVLLAFGAYTAHNSFADILLMLAATAVGIAAILWDWPRAPLLLALVLGDIAERYLFLSYSLYEWTWLKRPLVIAFAAVTIAGVAWPFVRTRLGERRRPQTRTPGPAEDTILMPRRLLSVDLAITVAFLIVAVAVLLQARAWPFRTSLFPLAAGSVLFGMALLKLALALAPARRLVGDQAAGTGGRGRG